MLLNMFWVNTISHDSCKPQTVRQTLLLTRGAMERIRNGAGSRRRETGVGHKSHSVSVRVMGFVNVLPCVGLTDFSGLP